MEEKILEKQKMGKKKNYDFFLWNYMMKKKEKNISDDETVCDLIILMATKLKIIYLFSNIIVYEFMRHA